MEGNRFCFLCSARPAAQFCICSNLPLLCVNCRVTHETKSGFHFSLPLEALSYVNTQNQQQYRAWLTSLANSQEKLRENIHRIDQCRREIEGVYGQRRESRNPAGMKVLQTLEELRTALVMKIEEAVQESSVNSYKGDYQPSSYLASLIWTHSYQQSSDPITVFTYTVQADIEAMKHFMGISFQTTVPEIAHLNYYGGKSDIWKEIRELKIRVEEGRQREETLIAQGLEREKLLIIQGKEREAVLISQAKCREDILIEQAQKADAALQCTENRNTQLATDIAALKVQLSTKVNTEETLKTSFQQLQTQFNKLDQLNQKLQARMDMQEKREKEASARSQRLNLQFNEFETLIEQLQAQNEETLERFESETTRLERKTEAMRTQIAKIEGKFDTKKPQMYSRRSEVSERRINRPTRDTPVSQSWRAEVVPAKQRWEGEELGEDEQDRWIKRRYESKAYRLNKAYIA